MMAVMESVPAVARERWRGIVRVARSEVRRVPWVTAVILVLFLLCAIVPQAIAK